MRPVARVGHGANGLLVALADLAVGGALVLAQLLLGVRHARRRLHLQAAGGPVELRLGWKKGEKYWNLFSQFILFTYFMVLLIVIIILLLFKKNK